MIRRAWDDAWDTLMGRGGLVVLVVVEAVAAALIVLLAQRCSIAAQATATLLAVLVMPLVVFGGMAAYRLRRPMRRWVAYVERNRDIQLMFHVRSLEEFPRGELRCDLVLPDGSLVSDKYVSATTTSPSSAVWFDFPRDFGRSSIEDGMYVATFWWKDSRYGRPIRIASASVEYVPDELCKEGSTTPEGVESTEDDGHVDPSEIYEP